MDDFSNRNDITTSEALMRVKKAAEELTQQKAIEKQKKELYNNKVLKVAE